jgi:hypothetical protein
MTTNQSYKTIIVPSPVLTDVYIYEHENLSFSAATGDTPLVPLVVYYSYWEKVHRSVSPIFPRGQEVRGYYNNGETPVAEYHLSSSTSICSQYI